MTAALSVQRPRLLARTAAPLGTAALLVGSAAALALRDPHAIGSWGYCPFLALTGLPCPFCGGLRAVWDLEHGDLTAAVRSNLLVVLVLPVLVVAVLTWLRRRVRGDGSEGPPAATGRVAALGLVVLLGFGLLRWLPAMAWLTP
ncbi:DUF2752 domain-containing protein [Angustibacter sp. McL0619]|uniref:DUF2752 domain-containing protein n=1 Tax=Angustibacter sp. McL0619 TaxID=3415676 RepID=UPI003CF34F5F